MAEDTLPANERDLLDISLRQQPDPFLVDLIELAQHGSELAVGLLVNGMVVIGRLDRDHSMAQALSELRRHLISGSPKPEGQSDEQWETVKEQFALAPLQFMAERDQFESQVFEEYSDEGRIDLAALPADVARQVREIATRGHITLTDVRIAAPGQDGMTALPILRIAAAGVTGWWFAMPDEAGTSNIELWSSEG